MNEEFIPHYGTGQIITTGAAAAVNISGSDKKVRVVNTDATNFAYFRVTAGTDTSNATSADVVVAPRATVIINKAQDHTRLSHVAAAGTPIIHVMTGN